MDNIDLTKLSLKELYILDYSIQWELIRRFWLVGLILIIGFIIVMTLIRKKL